MIIFWDIKKLNWKIYIFKQIDFHSNFYFTNQYYILLEEITILE